MSETCHLRVQIFHLDSTFHKLYSIWHLVRSGVKRFAAASTTELGGTYGANNESPLQQK